MERDQDAKRRRLAAIVFTDIVGFSALVNRDEGQGAQALDAQRRVVRRTIGSFGGREIETAGDSFLLEFSSTFAALRCVVMIHQTLAQEARKNPEQAPIQLRASVHLGDIEHRRREVFGDGVNIAARLLPLAPPGGIAVSDLVHSQIRHRLAVTARSIGPQELKNIRYPVEVFLFDETAVQAIPVERQAAPRRAADQPRGKGTWGWVTAGVIALAAVILLWRLLHPPAGATSPKPRRTIAVLPFSTFSSGKDDRLLAFGLQDSVLTSLARAGDLRVISRTSVMQYEAQPARNLKSVAKELGASTVLEGSLQRNGDRLQVQMQLIDAETDEHLWAQSFDRRIDDLFAVQASIAQQVTQAIKVKLSDGIRTAIAVAPTTNLQAYTSYVRAEQALTVPDWFTQLPPVQADLEKALALDDNFALARTLLARVHVYEYVYNVDRRPARLEMAKTELLKAAEQAPELPQLHSVWGLYYLYGQRDLTAASAEYLAALEQLPNDAGTLRDMGSIRQQQGRLNDAVVFQRRALELDPNVVDSYTDLEATQELLRDYAGARRTIDRLAQVFPKSATAPVLRANLAIFAEGDVAAAQRFIQGLDRPGAQEKVAYYADNLDEAIRQLQRQPDWQDSETGAAAYPQQASMALYYWLKGDRPRAQGLFRQVVPKLEVALKQSDQSQWDQVSLLGMAYAALGDPVRAHQQLAKLQGSDCCDNPITRGDVLNGIAATQLLLGEVDPAVSTLETLLSKPTFVTARQLAIDPMWKPLRTLPRFQALLARQPPVLPATPSVAGEPL